MLSAPVAMRVASACRVSAVTLKPLGICPPRVEGHWCPALEHALDLGLGLAVGLVGPADQVTELADGLLDVLLGGLQLRVARAELVARSTRPVRLGAVHGPLDVLDLGEDLLRGRADLALKLREGAEVDLDLAGHKV